MTGRSCPVGMAVPRLNVAGQEDVESVDAGDLKATER